MMRTWDEWLDELAHLIAPDPPVLDLAEHEPTDPPEPDLADHEPADPVAPSPPVLDLADHELLRPYFTAGVEPCDLVRHALATIDGMPGDTTAGANLFVNPAHQIWRQAEMKAGRLGPAKR
jgi:hypothetical protein